MTKPMTREELEVEITKIVEARLKMEGIDAFGEELTELARDMKREIIMIGVNLGIRYGFEKARERKFISDAKSFKVYETVAYESSEEVIAELDEEQDDKR